MSVLTIHSTSGHENGSCKYRRISMLFYIKEKGSAHRNIRDTASRRVSCWCCHRWESKFFHRKLDAYNTETQGIICNLEPLEASTLFIGFESIEAYILETEIFMGAISALQIDNTNSVYGLVTGEVQIHQRTKFYWAWRGLYTLRLYKRSASAWSSLNNGQSRGKFQKFYPMFAWLKRIEAGNSYAPCIDVEWYAEQFLTEWRKIRIPKKPRIKLVAWSYNTLLLLCQEVRVFVAKLLTYWIQSRSAYNIQKFMRWPNWFVIALHPQKFHGHT